jgi:hypothetical protein
LQGELDDKAKPIPKAEEYSTITSAVADAAAWQIKSFFKSTRQKF